MRKYEVVIIFAPTLSDDEVEQSTEDFKKAAEEKGAQITSLDQWGKRKLAYPIQKHTEGIYVILTLEEPAAEAVGELERRFRVSETVIRFLTVRIDLDLKRAEKFKVRRSKKKQKTVPSGRIDSNETATV
ncbi:MAG: 30S ribosomal protein S6 [Acidobacteria bacterium]|nr:30S ribosomal protein S6 [Acidobacteriota bacterium]